MTTLNITSLLPVSHYNSDEIQEMEKKLTIDDLIAYEKLHPDK